MLQTSITDVKASDDIYSSIKKLQPSISNVDAVNLSNALRSNYKSCGVSWQVLLSIAYNESSLNKKAVNKKTLDFGLYQISIKMIRKLDLDVYKILTQEDYAIKSACKIISYNKKVYSHKHKFWIGIYRSGTALHRKIIKDNAISYDNMIRSTASKIGHIY